MKKILLAVALLAGVTTVSAQDKGKLAVGATLGLHTEGSQLSIGAKARYGLAENIRLDGTLAYTLPQNNASAIEVSANAQYVFKLNEQLDFFPLAGLGYYRSSISILGKSISSGNFITNVGAGVDYKLSPSTTIGLEAKYMIVSGFSTPALSANVMFKL